MGDRIAQLRDHYNLSQTDFAALIKVDRLTVGNLEKGVTKKFQKGETLNNVISVFGTTKEWLEDGNGEMLPNGIKELRPLSEAADGPWKDEAWGIAKDRIKKQDEQIEKKDQQLDKLTDAFTDLAQFLRNLNVPFLHPVDKTA